MSAAALLDQVIEDLYRQHTTDADATAAARRDYEERRGVVHQDHELWESWSAAFVEWYVVERVPPGDTLPLAARTYRELASTESPDEVALSKAAVVRALLTSQRSLYEVVAMARGRIELLDLLGGAEFHVAEQRTLHGVEIGDVAELRLVGVAGEVRFGRTFIYHPKVARNAIVDLARHRLASGASRRDVIDLIAQLRVQITRYRHMSPARIYQHGSPGSRIV